MRDFFLTGISMMDIIKVSMMDIEEGVMAKLSPYETGQLTDSIFFILLTTIKPVHGYQMMQEISEMTEGIIEIGPATMYTSLKKLKSVQWIVENCEREGKIIYEITQEGRDILIKNMNYRKEVLKIAEIWYGCKENG
jgi:DNA-binding PadR family transcriptional regulator